MVENAVLVSFIDTIFAASIGVIFAYFVFKSFRKDLSKSLEEIDKKVTRIEDRIEVLETRMFQIAVGKQVERTFLEEVKEIKKPVTRKRTTKVVKGE